MKKTKRILALIGAILLLLLYVVAFVATVLDHTSDMRYWKAADDKESDDVTKKP